jgi:precorrin-2 dehydrogenase / sirohydrochlorin ferrochelatase
MKYYPINLDVRKRRCLVVGGGGVGARKVKALLDCGAAVTVVSPETVPELDALAGDRILHLEKRPYRETDLEGCFLVIGATDDEALNRRISRDAENRNMLCNIADFPEACNFILPSVVRRGDLIIAISTSGRSPAFAKTLRQEIETRYGPEYGDFLCLMGAIRRKLLAQAHAPEEHKPLFERIIAGKLLEMIRENRLAEIDVLLLEILGKGFTFRELMESNS